jgi:hypothetical protein
MPNGKRHRKYSQAKGQRHARKSNAKGWVCSSKNRASATAKNQPVGAKTLSQGTFNQGQVKPPYKKVRGLHPPFMSGINATARANIYEVALSEQYKTVLLPISEFKPIFDTRRDHPRIVEMKSPNCHRVIQ